ncbi:MAG: helix-turn-helix domain-containing protein [Mycobacterium sp.]|uniref:helix-turn-helix domain-containing protein n=1 Tax=Mycobacterium sp. TaxID=1785 RepID=UPI003F98241C
MGLREQTDIYFGTKVRIERERRGWSQEELAKRLTENGIPVYSSTIAKIESLKKPRAVRLGEAAGIADLFGISLDGLLGRHAGPGSDLWFALRALADSSQRSAIEVMGIATAMRDRLVDLIIYEFDGRDLLTSEGNRAAGALLEATEALMKLAKFQLSPEAEVRMRGDLVASAAEREEQR